MITRTHPQKSRDYHVNNYKFTMCTCVRTCACSMCTYGHEDRYGANKITVVLPVSVGFYTSGSLTKLTSAHFVTYPLYVCKVLECNYVMFHCSMIIF